MAAFLVVFTAAAQQKNYAQNPGFEEPGSPLPRGWTWDTAQTGRQGNVEADRSRAHSGSASLRIAPNKNNNPARPLAVGQMIPAASLRGQTIEFSGYVRAEGEATAVLGLITFVGGRPAQITASEPSASDDWSVIRQQYSVPQNASELGLICSAGGKGGAVWFDDVALAPVARVPAPKAAGRNDPAPASADPRRRRPLSNSGAANQATVEIDAEAVIRHIPRTLFGANVEWIWNGNGIWSEEQRAFDPQLLRLTRDLGVTLLRYPGGTVSDFYHWRDGVGSYERRPLAIHGPIPGDKSRPNFGTDEALDFAARVGAELLVVVNAGTGTAQEAADWVRYVNAKDLRVRYWEVGNELYMDDGSPAARQITIDPATYASRFLQFAKAMRAADPRIEIGATGGVNEGRYQLISYPDWNRILLERAGDQIDFLSVHNSYAPGISNEQENVRTVYRALFAAPALIARNIRTLQDQVARYAPARASKIHIAVTEWGPLFQVDPNGRFVLHTETLGSAVFAASALKTFIESPVTTIANFHVLNDLSIMGWIGSRSDAFPPRPIWTPTPRYYAFQLFTNHFGPDLISSRVVGPTFDTQAVGGIDATRNVPYLEIVSSLSSDRRSLTIMGINRDFDQPMDAKISLQGFQPSEATAFVLEGSGVDANTGTVPLRVPGVSWAQQAVDEPNPHFYSSGTDEVRLSSAAFPTTGAQFTYRFPAMSVTALVLKGTAGVK